MLRWFALLLGLLVAGVAWWAVQCAPQPLAAAAAAGEQPPAPYPQDMWQRLARLAGLAIVRGSPAELPAGLAWQDGAAEPPLGSPAARRGGVVRLCSVGPFPANLLAFGSPSPQFFHANAFERVELPLVQQRPASLGVLPGVACAWAVQGRTVFFRLHPAARYSNGRPVRAADYALGALLRAEAGGSDGAWPALCQAAEELRVYDARTLSLTLRHEGPLAALRAAALLHAAEPGFYAHFGSDYATRYAWLPPPTTGAYSIGRVEPGRLIELRRVPHWWAEELPHRRFTCNVSSIEHHFLTDEAQAWEFLLRGRLDALQTRNIAAWQRYGQESTRLRRRRFTISAPLPPYGIALNAEKLPGLELRRGLLQAMDMERAVLHLFRGEGSRLGSFTAGYGPLSPTATPRWRYDPAAARACFARAGYSVPGPDGILRRASGERLSVPLVFVPSEKVSALVSILRESAAAAGAEIVPEPLPWQLCAAKVRDGAHSLAFWATVPAAPLPAPERYFSSRARGDEAPFGLRSAEMDAALAACAAARSVDQLAAALARVDRLVYQLALWLPGWREDTVYLTHHPHLHVPEQAGWYYDVMDNHTFWLSEEGGEP